MLGSGEGSVAVAADLVSVTYPSFIVDVLGAGVAGLIVRGHVDMIPNLVRYRVDLYQRHGGPISGMSHAVPGLRHAMQRRHRQEGSAQKDAEGTNRILQVGSLPGIYSQCKADATRRFETDRRACERRTRPEVLKTATGHGVLLAGFEIMAGGKKTTIRRTNPRCDRRPMCPAERRNHCRGKASRPHAARGGPSMGWWRQALGRAKDQRLREGGGRPQRGKPKGNAHDGRPDDLGRVGGAPM